MTENDSEEKPQIIEPTRSLAANDSFAPGETGDSGEPIPGAAAGDPSPQVDPGSPGIQDEGQGAVRGIFIVIAAWFLPGLGHLMQRRLGRAMAAFIAVGAMAVVGLWMRGTIFPPHGDDAFGVLGFIADAGAGVFYLLAHSIEKNGADISRAAGDYGTRLLATSGVINLLFVLDALEISLGRKN